jgi:site-specific recombinase XerD
MLGALNTLARILTQGQCGAESMNWAAIRYQHSQALRSAVAQRYAPATANKMMSALRGVFREAWRLGLMDAESYHRAADVKAIRGETLPRGRALSAGEIRALFEACARDQPPAAARDAAILALLYGAGLRRSELVALELRDYSLEDGALTIRAAKGRKDRIVYVTNGGKLALDAWLAARGDDAGPMFSPIDRGGHLHQRKLTGQAIYNMLRKRASEAGVSAFSPHDLRRTFISHLLDAGADLSAVRQLAGHSSISTTARYDRRDESMKRSASELLVIPYRQHDVARRFLPSKYPVDN